MRKIGDKKWKHRGHIIQKREGMYVSGWNEMVRPLMAGTLNGMRLLINKKS